MPFQLSPVESRILGCLLEKERITPENYPLSVNALIAACNQTTSRDPVVHYDERTVEGGLLGLREKKLATLILGAGSRVEKYRHNLLDHHAFERPEMALLCVLMLRGPQTPGELRGRTERLHAFASVQEVEECLERLAQRDPPLSRIIPPLPGQKEKRYVQLLSGEPEPDPTPVVESSEPTAPAGSRLDLLETEINTLKTELAELRRELASFRKQFE